MAFCWANMAWSDIDFDLIKTGMVTKPALVSFGDYLNEFLKAGQERYKMIADDLYDNPNLPDIDEWQTGYIRQRTGSNTDSSETFPDQFRALIDLYNKLWYSETYYYEGVLEDLENYEQYEVLDEDLELEMGAEAWDIFNNYKNLSFGEIFKASILQGFYKVYTSTLVVFRDINSGAIKPDTAKKIVLISGEGYRFLSTNSPSRNTFAEAVDYVNDNAILWQNQNQRGFINIHSVRKLNFVGFPPWSIFFNTERGNYSYGIKQEDLNDTIVQSDIYIIHSLIANYRQDDGVEFAAYDPIYPQVNQGDPSKLVSVIESNIDVSPDGTIYEFDYRGNDFINGPQILPFELNDPAVGQSKLQSNRFNIYPEFGLVNLNLPVLEYYIPDL